MRPTDKTYVDAKTEQFRDRPDFVAHQVLLDLNEQIVRMMSAQGLRNKDLADRLGVSRGYVTRLLDGQPNLTVKSLAAIAVALGGTLSVQLAPTAVPLRQGWVSKQRLTFETQVKHGRKPDESAQTAAEAASISAAAA